MEEKDNKIKRIAREYYKRRDVQKAFVAFAKNREVVPRFMEQFGKRPDILQYETDVSAIADGGVTSFHCSEELWQDPLQLNVGMGEEETNNLREGWDLIIDIDTKYTEYGKIAAELIIEALRFHNVHSVGIKFSGGSGFHICVPWQAFPERVGEAQTKNLFPDAPRKITQYLHEIISKKLLERISGIGESVRGVKDFEGAKKVMPDMVLVSPRHLFRMPYSLHERTCLASVVIKPEQIQKFQPSWAKPDLIFPKPFIPDAERNEARELLIQALDFAKHKEGAKKQEQKMSAMQREIVIKDLTADMYPPCVSAILKGIKQDGRKRALFILMNFFKSINMPIDEIQKRIEEWDKLNYKPLRGGYIKTQIAWFSRQKAVLPPNCDKPFYKELAVCNPDNLCKLIKNPINYTVKKSRFGKKEINKK